MSAKAQLPVATAVAQGDGEVARIQQQSATAASIRLRELESSQSISPLPGQVYSPIVERSD